MGLTGFNRYRPVQAAVEETVSPLSFKKEDITETKTVEPKSETSEEKKTEEVKSEEAVVTESPAPKKHAGKKKVVTNADTEEQ